MTTVAVTADVQVACDDSEIPADALIETWIAAAVKGSARDTRDNVPAGDIEGLPPGAPQLLGDVVVCASVVAREAAEQGKSHSDHWAHMIVHGTLHLLGLDHENEAEAIAMEALETQILASQNVTDPYAGSL